MAQQIGNLNHAHSVKINTVSSKVKSNSKRWYYQIRIENKVEKKLP